MKDFIAVVKSDAGVLEKYQDFDDQAEAAAHVEKHGGFVVPNPGGNVAFWVVAKGSQSVTFDAASEADFNSARKWENVRAERDRLLANSDFSQLSDAPGSASNKTSWAAYRQDLRDIPATYAADPETVVWPTPPA